jgi:F0F1-type ATP synthase delta subunit
MSSDAKVGRDVAVSGSYQMPALLRTAVPLSGEQRSQILQGLRARFGTKLEVEFEVDPGILGGIWLRIGDRILDGTIVGRMGALQEKLTGAPPVEGNAVAQAHSLVVPIALVKTAISLTPEEKTGLLQRLRTRFGQNLQVRFQLDPAVLGGVCVRIGDEVLDGSLAGRLSSLSKAFVENGG